MADIKRIIEEYLQEQPMLPMPIESGPAGPAATDSRNRFLGTGVVDGVGQPWTVPVEKLPTDTTSDFMGSGFPQRMKPKMPDGFAGLPILDTRRVRFGTGNKMYGSSQGGGGASELESLGGRLKP